MITPLLLPNFVMPDSKGRIGGGASAPFALGGKTALLRLTMPASVTAVTHLHPPVKPGHMAKLSSKKRPRREPGPVNWEQSMAVRPPPS